MISVSRRRKALWAGVAGGWRRWSWAPHQGSLVADQVDDGGVGGLQAVRLAHGAVRVLKQQVVRGLDDGSFLGHAHITDGHFLSQALQHMPLRT